MIERAGRILNFHLVNSGALPFLERTYLKSSDTILDALCVVSVLLRAESRVHGGDIEQNADPFELKIVQRDRYGGTESSEGDGRGD